MEDEERPKTSFDVAPTNDELNRLSVHELEVRIRYLQSEIERTKALLKSKAGALSEAESVFKS